MTTLSKEGLDPVFYIKLKDAQDHALEKLQKANIPKTVDECSSFLNGKSRDIQKKCHKKWKKKVTDLILKKQLY